MHGKHPYEEQTTCSICSSMPSTDTTEKLYTWNDPVLLETSMIEFYEKLCIPGIPNWHFIFYMCAS